MPIISCLESCQCRRWGFGGSPTTICFSRKKIALPEMRVRRFTHNHCLLMKKSSHNCNCGCSEFGCRCKAVWTSRMISCFMFKKLSMPGMRVWRFTHNHLLFKKKRLLCRRWGFGGSPTTITFSWKKVLTCTHEVVRSSSANVRMFALREWGHVSYLKINLKNSQKLTPKNSCL